MWKKTDKWRPARYGGSGAVAVEKQGTDPQYGLAKPDGSINEKLASDLAIIVGVTVPKVELAPIEGDARTRA